MAKIHGKNAAIYVAGYDLSGRLNEATIDIGIDLADATVFQEAAKTYVEGQHNWSAAIRGLFDPAQYNIDEVLHGLIGSAADIITILPEGDGALKKGYGGTGELSARGIRVPSTSIVEVSASITGHGEIARVTRIDKQDVTANGNGTGVDMGAAGTEIIGILHVYALKAACAITVEFEQSSDNGATDAYASVGWSFGSMSAIGAKRYQVSGAVEQWLRAKWTVTGTSPTASFILLAMTR